MKKGLSLYWWCQIVGWSVYALLAIIFYASLPGLSTRNVSLPLLLAGMTGMWTTHTMRLFIIKARLLRQNMLKQVVYLFLTTLFFSFIYSSIEAWITSALHWGQELIGLFTHQYKINGLLMLTYSNTFFLSIWNLIYFSYQYVQKSQREQIERVRFEAELKIQQLESKNAKIEFQRTLADVSLTALRSQMNPHFIFNCLNSIKLYTTRNDTAAASVYLTKFSKLIRQVMENSRTDRILLSSELHTLELYIEMEAMRFKEKLQYSICIEKDVEIDFLEIPPLLLQPYVENAIWHGLMHKEEGGKIDINVGLTNRSFLEIAITDNGIGRAMSAELNSKTTVKNKSYGMKATSERITLLNHTYGIGADVAIRDLVDGNGKPSGTQVIIKIPVQ